jgi:hypothetical protein
MSNSEHEALKRLDADPDLDKLELKRKFSGFNIFEAVGMVGHELRHSHFLAFLLDPQQKHELDDVFVRQLLKHTLASAQKQKLAALPPISLDDLNAWDFSQLEVKREWEHIDIFLKDSNQKATITIENKVDSTEGEEQLKTYREMIENKFAGWRNLFVYLTRPGSRPPTDEYYIHIHYGAIIHCLEDILQGRSNSPTSEIDILIRHYVALLRRLGMDKSTVDLCDQVYKRHSYAIELIIRYRSDTQKTISVWLQDLMNPVSSYPISSCLEPDVITPNNIRFCVKEWDDMIPRQGTWTKTKRMLLFVFDNYWPKPINLVLAIGPGPEEIRRKLSNLVGK